MTGLRSEIERALKDLISNEEGMRLQGLAAVLAKQRWPYLIACERKSDLGADALAKPAFAAQGEGKVLACSLTATLSKITGDAKKIKRHFKDITKLVFATPVPDRASTPMIQWGLKPSVPRSRLNVRPLRGWIIFLRL